MPGERELSLSLMLAFLRRRRLLLVVATALGGLAAVGLTLLAPPTYVAQARMRIIEPPARPNIAGALANLPLGFGGLLGSSSSVAAEIEVIRSRPVAGAVVDAPDAGSFAPDAGLGLLDRVGDLDRNRLWKLYWRKLRGVPEPTGSLAVEVVRWDFAEDFDAPLRIRFTGPQEVEVSIARFFDRDPRRVQLQPGASITYREAELELRPDGDLTGRSFLFSRRPRQKTVDDFLRYLTIRETQRGSSVVSVSFPDADSAWSARIVNAVVRAYLGHNRQRQIEYAGRSAAFLESELERVRNELRAAEDRLQAFGERAGDIVLPETAVAVIEELVEADVNKATLELGARSKQALLEGIRAGELSDPSLAGIEAGSFEGYSPTVPLSALLAQRSALLAEYTEEWPEVKRLTAEIDDRLGTIQSLLEQEIRRDRELASDLDQIITRYSGKLAGLPEAEVELLRHRRSVETFSRIFTLLVAQIQEDKIAEASAIPNGEVIEWAVPPRLRSKPSLRLNLGVGALIGLLAGLAVAMLKELARPIATAGHAEEAFGVEVLHTLPRDTGSRTPLVVRDRSESAGAESFRILRGAFLHALEGAPRSAAVVLGVRTRDGASRTAANLACVLARTGRRVLLVDADLSGGVQRGWFGCPGEAGLNQAAAGSVSWNEAIVPTNVAGLELLPAGKPEGDLDLFASDRVAALLDEVVPAYDFVLFDAPPVMERADAVALAARVGAAVFVCRADSLPEHLAREAASRVRRSGARILGVVVNAVQRRHRFVV